MGPVTLIFFWWTGPVAGIFGPTRTQRRWTSGQGISEKISQYQIVSMVLVSDRTQNSTGKSGAAVQEDVMVVAFAR